MEEFGPLKIKEEFQQNVNIVKEKDIIKEQNYKDNNFLNKEFFLTNKEELQIKFIINKSNIMLLMVNIYHMDITHHKFNIDNKLYIILHKDIIHIHNALSHRPLPP